MAPSDIPGDVGKDGKPRRPPRGKPEPEPVADQVPERHDGPGDDLDREERSGEGPPAPRTSAPPRAPIVLTGQGPAFPKVPGEKTRSAWQHWIRSLGQIIVEVREHDGIDGSTYGLSDGDKAYLKNNLVDFCYHENVWIYFLEAGDAQG
jgi:hypothetical protein